MTGFFDIVGSALAEIGKEIAKGIKDGYEDGRRKSARSPAELAADEISLTEMIKSLDDRIPQYTSTIKAKITSQISSSKTDELLAISLYKQPSNPFFPKTHCYTLRPSSKNYHAEWAKLFFNYMRSKPGEGQILTAGVEKIVLKAVEDGSQEYFSSVEICEILRVGLIRQIEQTSIVQKIILKEMKSTGKLFDKEFKDVLKIQTQAVAADRFHDSLVHIAHAASGTALGHFVLSALSMPAVKCALVKIGGSVLMMEGMRAVITKIGITTLSVCFLGQAAASSFVPLLAIPIIIGVITYQYITLPSTLAEKIPPKIVAELGGLAPGMNENLAKKFVKLSFEKLFESIHEEAMKSDEEEDGDEGSAVLPRFCDLVGSDEVNISDSDNELGIGPPLPPKHNRYLADSDFEEISDSDNEGGMGPPVPPKHHKYVDSDDEADSDDNQDSDSDDEEVVESESEEGEEEEPGSDDSDNDNVSTVSSVRSLVEYHRTGWTYDPDAAGDSDGDIMTLNVK